MDYLNLAMRWLHIIPAIALVGGTIFMRFAVVPACEQLDDEQREKVQESVRRGWSRLLMPSILFLLISGFVNTWNISKTYDFPGGYYMMPLLAIKFVLAIAIFYIASLLAGRSEAASKFRQNQQTWLNVNILLAVLLVCIAGAMRLAREPKQAESEKAPSAAIETCDPARDGSLLSKR